MVKENVNKKRNIFVVLAVAVLLLVFSLASFGVTLIKVNEFRQKLTGYDTSTAIGIVNLTIISVTQIDLPNSSIRWGGGFVNSSNNCLNATLYTNGSYSVGNVSNQLGILCGNWSGSLGETSSPVYGLVIRNIGNNNVSVNLTSGKNASDFLGSGTKSQPAYQYNVSCVDANACNSTCSTAGHQNQWTDINTTLGLKNKV